MMSLENWWKWLLGAGMCVVIWAAFLYAPPAKALGESTRILFFHVPCAWVGTLAFFVSAWASFRYLKTSDFSFDHSAHAAAHIGFIFTVLATATGSIWAKEIWQSYWNWDPRQTSIFILLLIYAAYFALRSSLEDEDTRARLAAVYSMIACVTVPFLVFIVPRIYDSLHPDPLINDQAKINMNAAMQHVFWGSLLCFTILFRWMLQLKKRSLVIQHRLELARRAN